MRHKIKNNVSKRVFSPPFFLMLISLIMMTVAEARSPVANYSPVRVEIIDDRGQVFRQIKTSSQAHKVKRAYVEAKRGKRYSLRLRNMSNQRVGVVIAVDGRNVLTGKKSWLRSHEKMYILSPYETATYKGWRTGKSRVNRFFFTAEGNSYAKAWRDNSAMGVIALAVFNEQPRMTYQQENSLRSNKKARSSSLAPQAGTGFGREEYSPTMKVHFKARNYPIVKHFYKYEWRSSLCKRGVISCYDRPRKQDNRFWREESYAPYPPGMNRNDYHPNHNDTPYNDPRDHNPLFDF